MSRSMAQTAPQAAARGGSITTLDGRYNVRERIAAGGMGEVFLATDAVLAREVAIKVLHRSLSSDQGFIDRFRREARAAAGLNHPNIVAVYDWGAVDGVYYMVMEYVRGRSVRELLNANDHLAPGQAGEIVRQTLLALEHAHAKGIVHRDLKPENILITNEGTVKLTDMGLARAFADAKATAAGAVTGTVQYLAPEQIRGEPADPRSDLYALGIVTYELLTGRHPFTGETPMAIAYKHLSERVPAPSGFADDVPPDLDGFVESATDPEREMRPESAASMRGDIEQILPRLPRARSLGSLINDIPEVELTTEPTQEAMQAITQTIPRTARGRRRRWRSLLMAVLALGAIAAAAWGAWTYLIPHTRPVPVVDGFTVEEASAAMTDAGFEVVLTDAKFDPSGRAPAGVVLTIDPPSGTELEAGEIVTIVPSLGPPPVPVPDVVGETFSAAEDILGAEGFVVVTEEVFHDTVPKGEVIKQTPSGGKAPEGSEVTIVISRGHAPVKIPDVVGMTKPKAETALRREGFTVVVNTVFSDQVERDEVISVDPEEGSKAPFESAVTLTVSLGPEEFPAPRLTGLSPEAAERMAEEQGLNVSFFLVPNTEQTVVISQTPEAGTTVRYGDTITLYVA
jgi:serine/threonine-protein kinase